MTWSANTHALHKTIKQRKQRRDSGKLNAIPIGLKRFEEEFSGLEKKLYILATGQEKVGKSTITESLFVHNPLEYVKKYHPDMVIDYHIFLLEQTHLDKSAKYLSKLIYRDSGVVVTRDILLSSKNALSDGMMRKSEQLLDKVDELNKNIEYYNIYDVKLIKRKILELIEQRKEKLLNDDDYMMVIMLDHFSNLAGQGTIQERIRELSQFFIYIRDVFNVTIIAIQQQTPSGTGIDSVKLNRLYPTTDNLHHNKSTSRDADIVLGYFNPNAYKTTRGTTYNGYDLRLFGDQIRFMEVLRARNIGANSVVPLYFNGANGIVKEYPRTDSEEYSIFRRKRRKELGLD